MDFYKNLDLIIGEYDLERPTANAISGTRYVVKDDGTEILTPELFKQHARIDFNTDDTLVPEYIKAARQALERWSQLAFNVKTMNFTALRVPCNYKLMYGPVDTITTADFTNNGDLLVEGGSNINIDYTTLGMATESVVKIAVARYAAGLYVFRENVTDTRIRPTQVADESKEMLKPFMNLIWF